MKLKSFLTREDSKDPIADLCDQLSSAGETPDFVMCQHDVGLPGEDLRNALSPHVGALHCASSCTGTVTEASQSATSNAALLCFWDPEGDYGSACVSSETIGSREAAAQAVSLALSNADRDGEVPDLVWVSPTPGEEERVLEGIESVVGSDVPVIGGSAADNTVEGHWHISDKSGSTQQGVLVSVLFPSGKVQFAYQNGYAPTAHQGTVTEADGRTIKRIDGALAGEVVANWSAGKSLAAVPDEETNILAAATLAPLGKYIGDLNGLPNYLLAHPSVAHPDGSIDLFAEVAEGEMLTQMTGDISELANRAGRVAQQAAIEIKDEELLGAMVVYCGGCLMAVQEKLGDIVSGVNKALGGKPFVSSFTFGEQGAIVNSGNKHGNLMISCVTFSK